MCHPHHPPVQVHSSVRSRLRSPYSSTELTLTCILNRGQLIALLLACILPSIVAPDFMDALDIVEKVINLTKAPKITRAPRNLTVMAASSTTTPASFVCQATGNPAPNIKWFMNGQSIEGVNSGTSLIFKMPHGSVLRIASPSEEKHGSRILCIATNALGNATAQAVLHVLNGDDSVPKGFPAILHTGKTVIKQKNQEAKLKCQSSGDPTPTTEWFKDYLPINLSDPRYTVNKDQLLIRRVMEEDEGVYECMVTNKHGTAVGHVMKIYVRVRRYPPHFLPKMRKKVSVLPGSSVNLTCTAAGSPMPEIKWRQGQNLLMPRKRAMGRHTLMLTDIRESSNFTCVATSRLGEVEHTVQVFVKELPKPPNRVYITHKEARSAGLRWDPGPSDDVESYTVLVRRTDSGLEAPPRQFPNIPRPNRRSEQFVHYTLTKLEPNTRYKVQVMAISKIGRSEPSEPIELKTNELPPGSAPRNVRAEAITTRTLSVTWQPPKEKNGEITGYKVYFTRNPNVEVNKWQVLRVNKALHANINHLTSNATYHISVSALNSAGEGPISDHFPVIVTPGVPSRPRNFQAVTLGPTQIQLAWEPPEGSEESPASRVQEYVLKYKKGSRDVKMSLVGTRKAFLLENLIPDTEYRITLTARTDEGYGVPAQVIGKTAEYVPTSPVIVKVDVISSTELRVYWKPPREKRGRIEYFTIDAHPTNSSAAIQTLPSRTSKYVKPNVIDQRKRHYGSITNLIPNTLYTVTVRAVTRRGRGDPARYPPVKTLGEVPSQPRKLSVRYETSIMEKRDRPVLKATWQEPAVKHGDILQYRVRFSIVEPLDMKSLAPMEIVNVTKKEFSSENIQVHFGVTYNFRVAAMNLVDFGDEASAKVTTPDATPSASPQSLLVTDRGPNSVELKWKPPSKEFRNGRIVQFEVRYFQRDQRDTTETNLNTTLTSLAVAKLRTRTYYAFMVRAWTSAGGGPWTNPVYHQTSKNPLPPPPSDIRTKRLNERLLKITWRFPKRLKGATIRGFRIHYSTRDDPSDPNAWKHVDTDPVFSYDLTGLEPTATYVVRMSSISPDRKPGPWSEPVLPTKVDIPKETSLTVRELSCNPESADTLRLSWKKPEDSKDLNEYVIRIRGRATYVDKTGKIQQTDATVKRKKLKYVQGGSQTNRYENNLLPNTNYLLSVTSIYRSNTKSISINRRVNTSCVTLPTAPAVVKAPVPVSRQLRPELVIGLQFQRTSERNGPIFNYLLIVLPVSVFRTIRLSNIESNKIMKLANEQGQRIRAKREATVSFASSSYSRMSTIHTAKNLNPQELFSKGQSRQIIYIGRRKDGRPLQRDVDYVAVLRACVKVRKQVECRDSLPSKAFGSLREPHPPPGGLSKRNQGLQTVLLIGGPIVVALFLLVCVVVWCFFRRRPKMQRELRRHNPVDHSLKQPLMGSAPPPYQPMPTDPVEMRRLNYQTPDLLMAAHSHADLSAPPEVEIRHCQTLDYRHRRHAGPPILTAPGPSRKPTIAMMSHPPIPISQFELHVTACKASDNMKFSQEYESIDPGQQFTWEHSNLDVNKPKNRYANVIAYDHSRVVLQPVDGIPGSDYINANYMDGYKKQNAYIATQGPLPESVGDFWRLVWEQRSSTIVMMTRLEERARVKCDLYWPQKGSENYDDTMLVTHLDSLELAYYTIRTFALQRHGSPEKREVRQFQFTAWPDHGVPDHPTPLLMFLRRVRAANPPDAGPVVVHCSAGVGRTGAFIVIDAMLERIKQEKTIDVYGHVTCLRAQRNYTVQTEDQYIFIHDVLLEAVTCGNTEVPARNLAVHVQKLRQLEGVGRSQVTGMELEFRKIGLKPSNSPFLSANLPPNRLKNRLVNVLPYESTRVCLQPIRGVEGSDYVNASFIDGYLSRRAYVATQAPLPETTEDLWRMLWEHNSTIIVMLTKLREMGRDKCHQYWPTARSARYQYFVVDPLSEYNMNNYILREFKVTDARDGQSRTIRQFQYTEWPEQGVPPSGESLIDFIGQVHKTKKQFGQDGPITVHCSAGVGRTGVFLTLAVVLDRMRYEGVVDMFQTVKMLRTQRPAMVQTEDQYQFCYACAIEYLNSFDHYATDVR